MANKSVRIPTTAGGNDKYLTLKLENDIDFFEILSLKISQKDVYGSFNSDYGVIVGRVIANGGVGIPNAKLSVFIPISDDDKSRADIVAVYPYNSPRDKDLTGVRYNLLPRVAVNNPFLIEGDYAPKVPIGTFPTKEEITTNETYLEVYEKYYKYTTITNTSGDYMIFGVPIGIQTVHMSVDITDIGKYSMTPATMVKNLGYSPNLFTDNGTKIKYSTDLETLPNVELQEIAVEVRPFWGDTENFEIGITRQDFKIRALLTSSFIIFGAGFTDGTNSAWGKGYASGTQIQEFYRIQDDGNTNVSISSKRNSINIKETIFYYPNSISDVNISTENVNVENDIAVLNADQYVSFKESGQFVYIIQCNRKKIITNEFGNDVEVDSNSNEGIFTEFKGFITFEYSDLTELPVSTTTNIDGRPVRVIRLKYKFPQRGSVGDVLNKTDESQNDKWRKQYYTFTNGNYYSVAKYNTLDFNENSGSGLNGIDILDRDPFNNVGIIATGGQGDFPDTNTSYQHPTNGKRGMLDMFGSQWLNFCIYFIQQGYVNRDEGDRRTNSQWTTFTDGSHFTDPNNQLVASYVRNTAMFARNDRHQTTFINIPKNDIINILNEYPDLKGFTNTQIPTVVLDGQYANGINSNPITGGYGGYLNGNSTTPTKDPKYYFYRGFDTADCLEYLIRLNLI